jgi:SAM-dependent methyltransferase
MHTTTDVDVRRIIGRIRETLGRHETPGDGARVRDARDAQLIADISELYATFDPAQVPFSSHRPVLGRLVVTVKRVLRKLLTPILARQAAYNAANNRAVSRLHEHVVGLLEQTGRLRTDVLTAQANALDILRDELRTELLSTLGNAIETMRTTRKLVDDMGARLAAVEAALVDGAPLERLHEEARALRAEYQVLGKELARVTEHTDALGRRHDEQFLSARERMASTEARLRRILAVLGNGQPDKTLEPPPHAASARAFEAEIDSLRFAERFWGSEQETRDRRRIYVDLFRGHDEVLDVGSGRGEFLGLLAEAGIKARGVDLDVDMILRCKEKGLDVLHEDAFAHLASLPDGALGGVFAAQIVEHFEPARIIEFLRLCHRKLRAGGVLVVETPNPMCLMIFAQCFYMDFGHTRPIHAEALKFLAESLGFGDAAIQYTSPVGPSPQIPLLSDPRLYGPAGEQFNKSIAYVNELLFGYQDYALIARK